MSRHGSGVSVYAFHVRQTVSGIEGVGPLGMLVTATPVTYVLSFSSWRLVESRALALKSRGVGTSRPRPVRSGAEA